MSALFGPLLDLDHAGVTKAMMQAQQGPLSLCQIVMGAESAKTGMRAVWHFDGKSGAIALIHESAKVVIARN